MLSVSMGLKPLLVGEGHIMPAPANESSERKENEVFFPVRPTR